MPSNLSFIIDQVGKEITNPATEISLQEAKELDSEAQIGDSLGVKLNTDFGRIGAQTAKQVIIQKVRDAERENIYKEFKGSADLPIEDTPGLPHQALRNGGS